MCGEIACLTSEHRGSRSSCKYLTQGPSAERPVADPICDAGGGLLEVGPDLAGIAARERDYDLADASSRDGCDSSMGELDNIYDEGGLQEPFAGEVLDGHGTIVLEDEVGPDPDGAAAVVTGMCIGEIALPDDDGALASSEGESAEPLPAASSGSSAVPATLGRNEPWRDLAPPDAFGYVHTISTGRGRMRIQRGKPKGRVSISCFRHTGCRLLLNEARCPPDEALFQWLFEGPDEQVGDSREVKRRLAEAHMKSAKDRWSRPL